MDPQQSWLFKMGFEDQPITRPIPSLNPQKDPNYILSQITSVFNQDFANLSLDLGPPIPLRPQPLKVLEAKTPAVALRRLTEKGCCAAVHVFDVPKVGG